MAYGRKRVHIVAIPYPAQGHIVPLMQLCKKLAREEGFMVTFVNTEHNHARMMQAEAASQSALGKDDEEKNIIDVKERNNIRLVSIPGGLPPELHGDAALIVGAFKASEELSGPVQKLLEKLAQEGEPPTCIISDVLVSWTQDCADKVRIPRVAFWTSSAAVYYVIWDMYGLISQGKPITFNDANTVFENNNTKMVSCIPGLPPMDLNDLPIIVRSDPADFIYQFLSRQLEPMRRAAAVLLNTFFELEQACLQALPAKFKVPTYAIGPLLLSPITSAVNGGAPIDGSLHDAILNHDKQEIGPYKTHSAKDRPLHCSVPSSEAPTIIPVRKAATTGKVICQTSTKATKSVATYSNAGIFSEDVSCLQWLDKKESRSVLYISFGSIFAMSAEQFMELLEGLQASKQAFLWAIRPGFVQGSSSFTNLLPPSFLENMKDRGLLVSWVPQLSVLGHPAIGGFLTHCGWNSTLESVTLGVPMLCWPDVGERRTNGRLAVTVWEAGLEFSYSIHPETRTLLICRQEVERVILLLMDPGSHASPRLRDKTSSLQWSARSAIAQGGSSSKAWNLFLEHIQEPRRL